MPFGVVVGHVLAAHATSGRANADNTAWHVLHVLGEETQRAVSMHSLLERYSTTTQRPPFAWLRLP
mgnify:CR=1 FL=1